MAHRKLTVVVCLALLAVACERKQPESAPPRATPKRAAIPAGMRALVPGAPVFLSEQPLTVKEYLAYLAGTGQPVPEQFAKFEPGSPDAGKPITGLTQREARWCATWHLKRLPTAEEWQQASAVVGARPYPWTPEGAASAPDAQTFLVQAWAPGSEAEAVARRAKDGLAASIADEVRAETSKLRTRLQEVVTERKALAADAWETSKPAFFAMLDNEKAVAELAARKEAQGEVKDILTRLAVEKAKLAATVATEDLSEEERAQALAAYEGKLASVRAKAQEVRDELQKAINEEQEKVLALTKNLEEAGAARVTGFLAKAEAILAEQPAPSEQLPQALTGRQTVDSALRELEENPAPVPGLPAPEQIAARTAELSEQIKQLSLQVGTAEVDEIVAKLDRFGQTISTDFLPEKLLVQELNELADLRARRKAVQARLAGLQKILTPAMPEQPAAQ